MLAAQSQVCSLRTSMAIRWPSLTAADRESLRTKLNLVSSEIHQWKVREAHIAYVAGAKCGGEGEAEKRGKGKWTFAVTNSITSTVNTWPITSRRRFSAFSKCYNYFVHTGQIETLFSNDIIIEQTKTFLVLFSANTTNNNQFRARAIMRLWLLVSFE